MAKKEKKDGKKDLEKVTEVFDIEKDGEIKKEIVKEGLVEEKKGSKNQIKHQENQLKIILIVIGFLVLMSAILIYGANNNPSVKYKGVSFEKTIEGQLTLYKTSIPVTYNGEKMPYNFYLRTNPKDLLKINFTGSVNFLPNAVMNATEFDCDGDQVIAIANLLNQYQIIGTKVIKDENVGCDILERYLYISILPGNETKVVQDSETCYTVFVKDCEILPATEKLMAENFVALNEKMNN